MKTTYLNGKYLAQRTTGVQRVAAQLVQALDGQVQGPWVLLCPPGAALPRLRRIEVRQVGWHGLPLHPWEQVVLPWSARHGRLLSLAGSAPILARWQAAMLHDAAVFDHPEAYTRAFAAWYRLLFRRLARGSRPLLSVSEFSAGRLASRLGVPRAAFGVVPHGSDHFEAVVPDESVLDRYGLRDRTLLLTVASANPTKNLARLLSAFSRLRPDAALRLVIVGGSNDRVFRGAAAEADPLGVVRTGPLDDPSLKALYGHAVALVFPSLYEGFGLPPLEAMASGCPVVASRAASVPEVCGEAALYFDPLSVEDMARTIQRVLDDAGLRERLRAAGRERVNGYRWRDSAAALLRALGDVT